MQSTLAQRSDGTRNRRRSEPTHSTSTGWASGGRAGGFAISADFGDAPEADPDDGADAQDHGNHGEERKEGAEEEEGPEEA